jgi:Ca2+-binding EF-hand superfamily protein
MRMMRRLSSKSSSKRASRRASRDDSTADDRLRLDQGFDSSRGEEAEQHTNQAAARTSDDDMDEDELESYLSSLEETTAPSAAYSPPSVRPPTHSSTEAGAVPSLLSPSEGYGYFSLSPARPELRNVRGRASPLMRPSSSVQRGTTSTSMTGALNTKLAAHLRGLRQHFEQADEQGSGLVDLPGFQAAVRAMGVAASDARCAAAFLELDFDRSGTISYDEYVRFALREALSASFGKVVDLFRKWDADGDGHVSKAELQRACDEIGFDAPTEDLDALFEQFDADGSGKVSYQEMHKLLRQGGAMQLSPSLRPGAVRMATDASTAHFHGGRPGDASAARVRGRGSKNIANEFAGYPEELHRESLRGTSPRNLRWRPDTRRPPNSPMAAVRISVLGAVGNAHREAGGPLVRVQIAF